jgi:hypothetical protein
MAASCISASGPARARLDNVMTHAEAGAPDLARAYARLLSGVPNSGGERFRARARGGLGDAVSLSVIGRAGPSAPWRAPRSTASEQLRQTLLDRIWDA